MANGAGEVNKCIGCEFQYYCLVEENLCEKAMDWRIGEMETNMMNTVAMMNRMKIGAMLDN